MAEVRSSGRFARFDALEVGVCFRINRLSQRPGVTAFFSLVSRLGNGLFWYALMLCLPLYYGLPGVYSGLQMLVVGIAGLLIYRLLKQRLVRERPYIRYRSIACGTPPLDRYSFPSGHTLHAVSFTVLLFHHHPELGLLATPFALLVAVSRVILGLHYPSDVMAGAGIGLGLALLAILGKPLIA